MNWLHEQRGDDDALRKKRNRSRVDGRTRAKGKLPLLLPGADTSCWFMLIQNHVPLVRVGSFDSNKIIGHVARAGAIGIFMSRHEPTCTVYTCQIYIVEKCFTVFTERWLTQSRLGPRSGVGHGAAACHTASEYRTWIGRLCAFRATMVVWSIYRG